MRTKFLPIFLLFLSFGAFGQGSGEVIITEIYNRPLKPSDEQLADALPNNPPDADTSPNEGHTEWFEVFNTTNADVVMDGWIITDASSSSNFTVISSFTLAANSYAVFSGFNIPAAQGGLQFDYFYDYKKPSFNNESSYADEGDTSCPDGVVLTNAAGDLVDEVRYDYGYGNYIGNPNSSSSCNTATSTFDFPPQEGSSRISIALTPDPGVMNSADNDLAANWAFSSTVYDEEGDQTGTPGTVNDGFVNVNDPVLGQAIDIYPNPANDVLTIGSDLEGEFTVVIFNVMGEQMNEITVNERSIDVSALAVGMYSMKISLGEKSTVKKVVVQR